jgi:hypothetical protein
MTAEITYKIAKKSSIPTPNVSEWDQPNSTTMRETAINKKAGREYYPQ